MNTSFPLDSVTDASQREWLRLRRAAIRSKEDASAAELNMAAEIDRALLPYEIKTSVDFGARVAEAQRAYDQAVFAENAQGARAALAALEGAKLEARIAEDSARLEPVRRKVRATLDREERAIAEAKAAERAQLAADIDARANDIATALVSLHRANTSALQSLPPIDQVHNQLWTAAIKIAMSSLGCPPWDVTRTLGDCSNALRFSVLK